MSQKYETTPSNPVAEYYAAVATIGDIVPPQVILTLGNTLAYDPALFQHETNLAVSGLAAHSLGYDLSYTDILADLLHDEGKTGIKPHLQDGYDLLHFERSNDLKVSGQRDQRRSEDRIYVHYHSDMSYWLLLSALESCPIGKNQSWDVLLTALYHHWYPENTNRPSYTSVAPKIHVPEWGNFTAQRDVMVACLEPRDYREKPLSVSETVDELTLNFAGSRPEEYAAAITPLVTKVARLLGHHYAPEEIYLRMCFAAGIENFSVNIGNMDKKVKASWRTYANQRNFDLHADHELTHPFVHQSRLN